MRINTRIAGITPSITLGITSKAKEMAAEGREIFSFAAGEPDVDTPEGIKNAAVTALKDGCTKYAPVPGMPALLSAITHKLKTDNNLDYDVSQIVVSDGAKHSLFNIFMAMCNDGDEVIIPAPYWLSYPEMVSIAGGKPVFVECLEDNGYKMTADQFAAAITDKTRAVVINTPSNPVGCVYSRDELESIAAVAVEKGVIIISDEIYEKILYDDAEHVSIGSLSKEVYDLTVTVNGFSKAFSMTGWRLGYFAGPAELSKAARALQSHSTSGAVTFAQYGAVEALKEGDEVIAEMLQAFAKRREYLYGRLTSIEEITCVKPLGAFYMLPNISRLGMGSVEFCEKLLDSVGVAAVPGAAFGADNNIRLSYASSMENIESGMDRFEEFIKGL